MARGEARNGAVRPRVTFVIMAGGRGERLWPLVRTAVPKACLAPDGRRTLLQTTVDRLRRAWPQAGWLIVTTEEHAEAVRRVLPGRLRRCILAEPEGKNTAACITLAAAALAAEDPRRIMVVAPADHWIGSLPAFCRALRAAIRASAREDAVATIGIAPTEAHPGLGYLCAGARCSPDGAGPRVFRLARFIEKPSRAQARRLIAQARTYWNSGLFIGPADAFLRGIAEWLPEHARRLVPLAATLGRAARVGAFRRQARRAYAPLRAVSFDRSVMGHLTTALVVEGRFPWADLGSWDVWARLGTTSRALTMRSRNVTVVGEPAHLVAAVGVRDLLVVHTPSATLICRPQDAQAVRQVVRRVVEDPRLAAFR
jgi:mannose-1-phosphate guanylyltransferase